MAFIKWDSFRDILTIQDRMNRLFDETLVETERTSDDLTRRMWSPAVDIYETDDDIVLIAELPGINKNAVDVEVKDNILLLRGERQFDKDIKEENYYRMERSYGGFHRSFTLTNIIDKKGVKAKFKNGILEVILPKAKQIRPKHIKIDT